MPVDTHLAATGLRILMAGEALERAISLLNARRVFQARMYVQQAVGDLVHARDYLKASGQYPALLNFVETLISYYGAEMGKIVRPASAPQVASELYSNQGILAGANPLLFPAVAH